MLDPLSLIAVAGKLIVDAYHSETLKSVGQGILGNRADHYTCKLLGHTFKKVKLYWTKDELPKNADLGRAIKEANIYATAFLFQAYITELENKLAASGQWESNIEKAALKSAVERYLDEEQDIIDAPFPDLHGDPAYSRVEVLLAAAEHNHEDTLRLRDELSMEVKNNLVQSLREQLFFQHFPELLKEMIYSGWETEAGHLDWFDIMTLKFATILKDPEKAKAQVAFTNRLLSDIKINAAHIEVTLAELTDKLDTLLSTERTVNILGPKIDLWLKDLRKDVRIIKQNTRNLLRKADVFEANQKEMAASIDTMNMNINTLIHDNRLPRLLTLPPFDTDIFIGRDEEIDLFEEKLTANQNLLLLVNGEGGVGKTTVASKFWLKKEKNYHHLIWLYCDQGIESALLSLASALGIKKANQNIEQMTTTEQADKLNDVIRDLAGLKSPALMVLDNANHIKDLEKHYQHLRRLTNFHILITSRVGELSGVKRHQLSPLNETLLSELFLHYYDRIEDEELPLLKKIINAVGRNTLVVEVLAKNLREINKYQQVYALADLLKDLQKKGLLLVQGKSVPINYHGIKLTKAKPEEIIKAMYDIEQLSAPEKHLLSNLAVLPAEKITYNILYNLLKPAEQDEFNDTLQSLSDKGWIEFDAQQNAFKVSPVIQEVVREENKNELRSNCSVLITTLTGIMANPSDSSISYTRIAGSVINFVHITFDDSALLGLYLCDRYLENGDAVIAEKILLDILEYLSQASTPNVKNYLIYAYHVYADVLCILGNYVKAREYYLKEKKLATELNQSFDLGRYADFLAAIGHFEEAEPILYKAHILLIKKGEAKAPDFDLENLGYSAHTLSIMMRNQGRYDEAVQYSNTAIDIYTLTRGAEHEYTGICLDTLASILIRQGILEEAKALSLRCEHIFKQKLQPDDVNWESHFSIMGQYWTAKKDLQKATEFYKKSLDLMEDKVGGLNFRVLDALISKSQLAAELADQQKISTAELEAVSSDLTDLVTNKLESLINIYGAIHPMVGKALRCAKIVTERLNNKDALDFLDLQLKEYQRLSDGFGKIRLDEFTGRTLAAETKSEMIERCRPYQSMPLDEDLLTVKEFDLPFFHSYKVYAFEYHHTTRKTFRYVLANSNQVLPIDFTNLPLYKAAKSDHNFSKEQIIPYLKFFFDAVYGRHGSFYIVDNHEQMPWMLTKNISAADKRKYFSTIKIPALVNYTNKNAEISLYILFNNSVFRSRANINLTVPADNEKDASRIFPGEITLSDEYLVLFNEDLEPLFQTEPGNDEPPVVIDLEGNRISGNTDAYKDFVPAKMI
ncbi:tetratricopeptide repeat protein [Pedobacter heparinus]|uniref:tetratricopeptide repeat protein n=1 Tax=Pedobacter heparinus TaxID=984 RepID=UPI00292E0E6C|nr:tetratricopeptide repeat protein [Pedobacter heparinus]